MRPRPSRRSSKASPPSKSSNLVLDLQDKPGRATINVARLFGPTPFFRDLGENYTRRVLNTESKGTSVLKTSAGPSSLGVGDNAKLSALGSAGYAGYLLTDVDWQAAGSKASFGIGDSGATKIGWGHRQKAALVRNCVLAGFRVSYRGRLGVSAKSTMCLRTSEPGYTSQSASDCAQSNASF